MMNRPDKLDLMLFGVVASQFESIVRENFPNSSLYLGSRRGFSEDECARIRALIGWKFPPGIFEKMPNLEWIQSVGVGVEDWIFDPMLPQSVVVSSPKGVYAEPVSEYVIWSLLTLFRRFHTAIKNQRRRRWVPFSGESLSGKTLGVAGLGHIGNAVARKAASLQMSVVGIVRETDSTAPEHYIDQFISYTDLGEVLGELDALVVCLPLTNETHGMFSKEVFQNMKRGAVVVNVAREGVADYSGLRDAVRSGHLAGAALDVFDKEPMRPWNPLWSTEGILITPHISAFTEDYKATVANVISENIDRFLKQQPLLGLVDRVKGY
jgi:phosphoglycerate dehydrogenase-like enzyme